MLITYAPALAVLLGWFAPVLTALLTKQHAASWVKGSVNLLIASAIGVLATILPGTPNKSGWLYLFDIGVAFVTAQAAHSGPLKSLGLTGEEGLFARLLPTLGLGGQSPITFGPPGLVKNIFVQPDGQIVFLHADDDGHSTVATTPPHTVDGPAVLSKPPMMDVVDLGEPSTPEPAPAPAPAPVKKTPARKAAAPKSGRARSK